MNLSHDAQLLLLGAAIALLSSLLGIIIQARVSLWIEKKKIELEKEAKLKGIYVPSGITKQSLKEPGKKLSVTDFDIPAFLRRRPKTDKEKPEEKEEKS